ncbi:MAG: hypothetical protein WA996_18435 [Candidatus Promineifilaceae bacterium]
MTFRMPTMTIGPKAVKAENGERMGERNWIAIEAYREAAIRPWSREI